MVLSNDNLKGFGVVIIAAIVVLAVYFMFFKEDPEYLFKAEEITKKVDDETERFLFTFEPKKDLTNVSIEYEFKDDKWDVLKSGTISFGNLSDGEEKEIKIDVDVEDDGDRPDEIYVKITIRYDEKIKNIKYEYHLKDVRNRGRYDKQ